MKQPVSGIQTSRSKTRPVKKNGIVRPINTRQLERLHIANQELLDVQRVMEKLFYWAAIIESSDDAIFGKTLDGIITSWNFGAERMYGYKPEEIIGKPVTTLFPEDKKPEFLDIMRHIKDGEAVDHYETRRVRKDGREILVSITVSPIKDLDGTVIGASTIARDITERIHSENAMKFLADASNILSSSLDYKTTLANVAKIAVPEISDWCSVEMLNDEGQLENVAIAHTDPKKVAWAKRLQKKYPVDMKTGQGSAKVIRSGKAEFYPLITSEMLEQMAMKPEQRRLIKKVGISSVMIVPICGEDKCIGAISFVNSRKGKIFTKNDFMMAEDLGKRASLAIENSRLYEAAQQAIIIRDNFISVASHELKTPVTSLKMYSQILDRLLKQKDVDKLNGFLGKIDDQINKMTILINDLLSVSRVQHGKMEFNFDVFDLNDLVKEAVDHIQATSSRHTIKITGSSKKNTCADRYRLYQVITNLLSNAIKYSPRADKVIIRITDRGDQVTVSVKDYGIGIRQEYLDKVFHQFFRVEDSDEKTFPGLGLGLYISDQIIQRHHGFMSVKSEKGQGSEFSFTIPYEQRNGNRPRQVH